ncbi:MAG: glycerate kinase [Erysipelotrichaceae bacterium]|nr:glycerate kinase [Erysipelotrichaceae bacterium]
MTKVLVLPDSFKGSLTSEEVGQAIKDGLDKTDLALDVRSFVIADGGEGTVAAFVSAKKGRYMHIETLDAYLKPIVVPVGILDDNTVVIEVASIVGLTMYSKEEANLLEATSFGVGLVLKQLHALGYKKIIVGLGGSSTNDGGMGLLQALGYAFYDDKGKLLKPRASSLALIKSVVTTNAINFSEIELIVASDVVNTLLGKNGATFVFGAQKHADDETLLYLESAMTYYNQIMSCIGYPLDEVISGGAAGGMGAALIKVLQAKRYSGIDLLLQYLTFDSMLDDNTIVISGEGQCDQQSAYGKVIAGIAKYTKAKNVPLYVICGQYKEGYQRLFELGVQAVYQILDMAVNIDECFTNAKELIIRTSEKLAYDHMR